MFTQMLSWSLEGIKVLNMVNRIKQTQGSLSSWKHQPHSLHSSCLLKALWPPKNNTSLIPSFFPLTSEVMAQRVPVLPWKKENVPGIKQCSLGCTLPFVCVQNGKQGQTLHCELTIHPKNNTPVEAGRAVHGDLYLSKQPSYYPFISFSPLNDNLHTHSGGNSMQ